MTDPVMVVDELRMRYRGAVECAVDGISFTVADGEIFGFLGPNGAGKSTTQRILTGLRRGHHGRADVLGRPVARWGPNYYEHVGVGSSCPRTSPGSPPGRSWTSTRMARPAGGRVRRAVNEQIRRISSWAAILFARTLIGTVDGMNFRHMPELGWTAGYPFAHCSWPRSVSRSFSSSKRRGWL